MEQEMRTLVGLEQAFHGNWSPGYRLAGIGSVVVGGAGLWLHANYAPGLYGEFGDFYETLGAMLFLCGVSVFIVGYVFPFSSRKATRSPVVIGVDRNRLMVVGEGKFSRLAREINVSEEEAYSADGHFIADPARLTAAIESVLCSLKVRTKPFVVLMPFQEGKGYTPTPAEEKLLHEAAAAAQTLDVALVRPASAMFNHDLPVQVGTGVRK